MHECDRIRNEPANAQARPFYFLKMKMRRILITRV